MPTGFAVAVPAGYEIQVRSRSGWAWSKGVTVLNGPGTIDSDYRGELKVMLVNLGDREVKIMRGNRIAQAVVAPVIRGEWVEVENLDDTERGSGGFGHTVG